MTMTMGRMTAQQRLKECGVFAELTNAEMEKIASSVSEKKYGAGATIFKGGDSAEELLVIEEGKVALQMPLAETQVQMSRRLTVDVLTRNEVIGWSAVVAPHIYTFSAVCLQDVKVLSVNGAKLRWILQDNPKIGYAVLKGLIKVVASRLDETRQLLISERVVNPKLP